MAYKVGVVGATGVVGEVFIHLLESRNFPVSELKLFASENSKGQTRKFKNQDVVIECLGNNCFDGLDVVFFSSGDDISKEWGPRAVEAGAFAVDNSAAFRMSPEHKLIVPEINGDLLSKEKPELIANPNCSTIQLVMALAPLKRDFGVNEVRVATYQAVSGAGKAGKEELSNQIEDHLANRKSQPKTFSRQIAFNTVPEIGSWNAEGYCSEEVKIMNETKKILDLPNARVSAFTVRVSTFDSHSEAAWVTLDKEVSRDEVIKSLKSFAGLEVNEEINDFVTQADTAGTDPVYVGRIHQDMSDPKTWLFWITADNLLKGAALNGIQIAEKIFK